MLKYAIKRILLMIPTLLAVAVIVFLVLRVVPGDIVELKLTAEGGEVSLEQIEAEKTRFGLQHFGRTGVATCSSKESARESQERR